MFFVQHDLQHMNLKLTKHKRFCKQNNQIPTKSHDELKDNSTVLSKLGQVFMPNNGGSWGFSQFSISDRTNVQGESWLLPVKKTSISNSPNHIINT